MQATLRASFISVVSNSVLVILKLFIGLLIGSVSVISEAIHSGIDLIAALLAAFSINQAAKPADERHRYGHGKIENISGTIEALLIFVAAIWIIYEAIHKTNVQEMNNNLNIGIAVMLFSALVNFFVSKHLFSVARKHESVALEADALHLRTDVYTSIGVLVGLVLIKITGILWIDSLMAILVALLITKSAYELTKDAFFPLLDENLPEEEEEEIIKIIETFKTEYLEFHKLRGRKSGSTRHIDLHLVVPKNTHVDKAHNLSHQIINAIKQKYATAEILVHLEPCHGEFCKECLHCDVVNNDRREKCKNTSGS